MSLCNAQNLRLAVFGSFYRGYYVLSEMLSGPLSPFIDVVGVATDDPRAGYVSPGRRVWQYEHDTRDETMVKDLAAGNGLEPYTGRVNCEAFQQLFETQWKPDICLMATFGQRIGAPLFNYPAGGFYNFHPSDLGGWPSRYAGGNPFRHMIDDGARSCVITMHHVDAGFDSGEIVARSPAIYIPGHVSVVDMHKISSPTAGILARDYLLARFPERFPGALHGVGGR